MSHVGLRETRGALGVFLLVGPTGTGKTELAKSMATALCGEAGEKALFRVDLTAFKNKTDMSTLIGSPLGHQVRTQKWVGSLVHEKPAYTR